MCTVGGALSPWPSMWAKPAWTERRTSSATSHLLEEDVDRSGVGPRHLEQVGHHALEAAQVVAEELQGPLRAQREVVAVGLEHLDRGRQGRER